MKLLLLALLAGQLLNGGALQIDTDLSGPHVLYRRLIGELDKETFAKMAMEFLQPKEVTLGVLAIYGSKWKRVVAGPNRRNDSSYDDARGYFDRYNIERSGCPEVQQAVKFGSGILLRWMNQDCRSGKRLLQGEADPTRMIVDGKRVELLEFSFSHPLGERDQHNIWVSLFARANRQPTAEHARTITSVISALTGVRNLFVWLRSDTWFFRSGDFPALFPWQGRPKFPAVERYLGTREAHCAMFGGEPIRCNEYTVQR